MTLELYLLENCLWCDTTVIIYDHIALIKLASVFKYRYFARVFQLNSTPYPVALLPRALALLDLSVNSDPG